METRNAGFATPVRTVLRNDLDVGRYVKDVLDRLLAGVTDCELGSSLRLGNRLPEAIRECRVSERKDRKKRKKTKRDQRRKRKGATKYSAMPLASAIDYGQ